MARLQGGGRRPRPPAHAEGRQAVQPQGVVGERDLRLPQAVLPADLGLAAGHGELGRRDGPEGAPQGGLLHTLLRRGDEPGELLRAEPRGARDHGEREGREPRARAEDDARGPRARQGQAPDPPDRHGRLRGREEHRRLPRRGRLRERPDPAHPVRAGDREGLRQAAADHPALDQQVLYPRSESQEEHGQVAGRAGPHRVRRLLGQPRPAARAEDLGGLHVRGRADRHREGARGDRGEEPAPRLLLRRRHHGRDPDGLARQDRRQARRLGDLLHRPARLRGRRRAANLRRRAHPRGGRRGHGQGLHAGRPDGQRLQHAQGERPDLGLHGLELHAREGPVPLRPALLER